MVPIRHYMQQTWLQNIKNALLRFKAWQRTNSNTIQEIKIKYPPRNYNLVAHYPTPELGEGAAWRTGHPWGRVHRDQLWRYWPQPNNTPSPTVYPMHEGLALELRKYPKTFRKLEQPKWQQGGLPDEWTPTWATGLISTKKAYQYGWFEAEIKLPTQAQMWSAFWLMGLESWPPEIDIFESFTYEDPNDIHVETNFHFGVIGDKKFPKADLGAARIPLKNPNGRWIQYACHWTENYIRIYMDGHCVQECKVPSILKQFSIPQYIILNNGCKDPKTTNTEPTEGAMLVRNVKIYQK